MNQESDERWCENSKQVGHHQHGSPPAQSGAMAEAVGEESRGDLKEDEDDVVIGLDAEDLLCPQASELVVDEDDQAPAPHAVFVARRRPEAPSRPAGTD